MNKKDAAQAIESLADLVRYAENYPNGAIHIGLYWYKPAALLEALRDIQMRHAIGAETKADKLLLEILTGLNIPA